MRGDELTSMFEGLLKRDLGSAVTVVTPKSRGSMLCLRFARNPKAWASKLQERNVHVDFREPDIIRATPVPLYNTAADIFSLVQTFGEVSREASA